MRVLSCLVLAAALLSTVEGCRKAELPSFVNAKEKNIMETNWEWSKGGVGMIMSPNDANIYVATKSTRNKMMWGSGGNSKNWVGRRSSTREVVVFYDDKVWSPQSLPNGFDQRKSVVVSFEEKNIRFYDFVHMSGGYYERQEEN
jgi:hypothetical protein